MELWNQVKQNDVTLQVTNSKSFIQIIFFELQIQFGKILNIIFSY